MSLTIEDVPFAWVRRELVLAETLGRGRRGRAVERIQEWLTLSGIAVVIDGRFGPATEFALGRFQKRCGLPETGSADVATFAALTRPLWRALTPPEQPAASAGEEAVRVAERHLAERPREVGGPNRGPWVRVYMEGHQGPEFLWCAGFVCFVHRQAAWHLGRNTPLEPTFSCDLLATSAEAAGRLVTERDLSSGRRSLTEVPVGSLFLQRRVPGDWNHTGLVVAAGGDVMETIEGNTNDGGSREGYEVCRRIRDLRDKDFVVV